MPYTILKLAYELMCRLYQFATVEERYSLRVAGGLSIRDWNPIIPCKTAKNGEDFLLAPGSDGTLNIKMGANDVGQFNGCVLINSNLYIRHVDNALHRGDAVFEKIRIKSKITILQCCFVDFDFLKSIPGFNEVRSIILNDVYFDSDSGGFTLHDCLKAFPKLEFLHNDTPGEYHGWVEDCLYANATNLRYLSLVGSVDELFEFDPADFVDFIDRQHPKFNLMLTVDPGDQSNIYIDDKIATKVNSQVLEHVTMVNEKIFTFHFFKKEKIDFDVEYAWIDPLNQ